MIGKLLSWAAFIALTLTCGAAAFAAVAYPETAILCGIIAAGCLLSIYNLASIRAYDRHRNRDL